MLLLRRPGRRLNYTSAGFWASSPCRNRRRSAYAFKVLEPAHGVGLVVATGGCPVLIREAQLGAQAGSSWGQTGAASESPSWVWVGGADAGLQERSGWWISSGLGTLHPQEVAGVSQVHPQISPDPGAGFRARAAGCGGSRCGAHCGGALRRCQGHRDGRRRRPCLDRR